MSQNGKTRQQLLQEVEDLRTRLEESEEILRAIQSGEVDGLVASGPHGEQVFTLQGAERPYRILVEAMQEGAVTLSADGIILYSNRRFAELLALPLEQVLGASVYTFLMSADQDTFRRRLQESWHGASHAEIVLRTRDGTPIPTSIAFSALPLEDIPTVGLVVTDLTDQKRVEEATRRLISEQAARTEAEAAQRRFAFLTDVSTLLATSLNYKTMFDNLARLIIPGFADNYVVDIFGENESLRRVAFAAADPAQERAMRELTERYPPDPNGAAIRQVLQTGQPLFVPECSPTWYQDAILDAQKLALSPDFPLRSFMLLPLTVRDEAIGILSMSMTTSERYFSTEDMALAQELVHRIAQAIDNARLYAEVQSSAETLRRRVAERTEELQQALLRAQSADQAKTTLLATVSHEMRTPLSSIIGFSNLLLRRETSPEKTHLYTSMINAEARRLSGLVDDFLDLQRLASGREVFRFNEVDIGELLRDVVSKQELGERDLHTIRLDVVPVPMIYADSNRIRQVMVNLLSNALKYSPNGGEIKLSLCHEDNEVIVAVQDHGLGIPAEELNHLFERFKQGLRAEQLRIRGTGLGLALCKELVDAHRGRIWAESAGAGHGSTFQFALPLNPQSRNNQPEARPSNDAQQVIVVIEDDLNFATYLAERLGLEQYAVHVLGFNESTPVRVAAFGPALVILDIREGDREMGWSVLAELKGHPATQSLPVLICSILYNPEQADRFEATAYVHKPVDETLLLGEIARLLGA